MTAFMKPQAQWFDSQDAWDDIVVQQDRTEDYPDGPTADLAGYYGRLSAPGYLDCTDWSGPFETSGAAISDCMETFDVDENGNDLG